MKKSILSIAICLVFTTTFAQTPNELIGKMKQRLIKLKTLDCEITEHSIYYPDRSFNYKKNALIVFDTNTIKKPHIKKANISSLLYNTVLPKSEKLIISGDKSIEIDNFRKEIAIEQIDKKNRKEIMVNLAENCFPFLIYESVIYLDSIINPEYKSESMNMKTAIYEVSTDTACLSGDCLLLKIMATCYLGTEVESGKKDSTVIVNFKMENHYYWINKNNFFIERYRREWTLENNQIAWFRDYRFTKIKVNTKINDAVFIFDKAFYKDYRIGEITAKGSKIIQEAVKK